MANSPLTFSSSSTCVLGRLVHLFDRDRIEIGEKGFARRAYFWIDHPLEQHRVCAEIFGISSAQRHRGAQ